MKLEQLEHLENLEHEKQKKFIFLSYLEGLFYALMVSSSESYAIFFSVKNGLSGLPLAAVSTAPLLLGALAQWIFPQIIKKEKLKQWIAIFMSLQLLGLMGLYLGLYREFHFTSFFLSLSLYWIGGLSIGPLWLDWMASHFPRHVFRLFLARRNGFVIFCTLTFYLTIAFFCNERAEEARRIIFALGVGARLLSLLCQLGLGLLLKKGTSIFHRDMLRETSDSLTAILPAKDSLNKMLWTCFLWTGVFKWAVNLSSPFFLPYMVNDLKLSMWHYTILTAVPMLARTVFLGGWGRASDGLRPFLGLQVACVAVSFIPFLWTFSRSYHYLLGLEFCSGVFWAGFELSTVLIIQNFVHEGTARIHGLHMAIMNICAVVGSLMGAFCLQHHLSYYFIFYLSSSLRLIVAILFIHRISQWQEARFRLQVCGGYLISVLSLRPPLASIARILLPTIWGASWVKRAKENISRDLHP